MMEELGLEESGEDELSEDSFKSEKTPEPKKETIVSSHSLSESLSEAKKASTKQIEEPKADYVASDSKLAGVLSKTEKKDSTKKLDSQPSLNLALTKQSTKLLLKKKTSKLAYLEAAVYGMDPKEAKDKAGDVSPVAETNEPESADMKGKKGKKGKKEEKSRSPRGKEKRKAPPAPAIEEKPPAPVEKKSTMRKQGTMQNEKMVLFEKMEKFMDQALNWKDEATVKACQRMLLHFGGSAKGFEIKRPAKKEPFIRNIPVPFARVKKDAKAHKVGGSVDVHDENEAIKAKREAL